ncbi:MAG: cysteine--tRNA ligase [Roseovarius sp.]
MTEIRLYNTASRRRERFAPLDPANVRMYVCGPTVYDRAHLGNARPVVVFDVLFRLLRHVYGPEHVTYVRNFTDVDDKINARAAETGRAIGEITAETTRWFLEDMGALGALEPTHMPRATQYIAQMIAMIETLIARGHAYVAEGHVLFAVDSYPRYGRLSGRAVEDMIAGARVEVAPYKRNPMDFVLWKPSTPDLPGWDSPWGRGRPGWHIECSAMSYELLGARFDIHGGGGDLVFPHHENEIAQSCSAHPAAAGEQCFAQIWLHNEMLQVEGRKMSKSLGNFFTVRDLLDQGVPGEVIRFVLLSTHYRKPMDWTAEKVREAEATLRKWRTLTLGKKEESEVPDKILEHLSNDLNTSECIFWLHQFARMGNAGSLLAGARALGLLTPELGNWFKLGEVSIAENEDLDWIVEFRQRLREQKQWDQADEIRDRLVSLGVVVADSKDGSSAYIEPEFLMMRLMSDIRSSFEVDGSALEAAVEKAEIAGVIAPLRNGRPRAWTGRESSKLKPFIEEQLRVLRKKLEALQ